MDTITPANYFSALPGCHNLCRIARGQVSDGERHDPRCAAVADTGYAYRESVAAAAERARR